MNKQIALVHLGLDLRKSLNPMTYWTHWYYSRVIRKELIPLIDDTIHNYDRIEGPKTIIALALKSYVKEVQGLSEKEKKSVPAEFLDFVIRNIKIFMFAGHDSTSITLAYCFYNMYRNPEKAAKLRAEHDEILGTDRSKAGELIAADPSLLNKMPYTAGFIRETLRIFPPFGGTIRQTNNDMYLTNPETRQRYPLKGFMVHGSGSTVHLDEKYWPEPLSFVPERWLVKDESDPWHPKKNTWRPFEMGPRNCIGQELVHLELRLILSMTAREFDFESVYPEGSPTLFGHQAYQVEHPDHSASAHGKDGLPMRVTVRE
jgi:hypothetical protein